MLIFETTLKIKKVETKLKNIFIYFIIILIY
jgi:hypothetical protein